MYVGLRALLIHKGTKHTATDSRSSERLRALLIHKGTKLSEIGTLKRYKFESFVNS